MNKIMITIVLVFVLLLSGCSVKDYQDFLSVFEDNGYLVSTVNDLNIFGLEGIDWVFVEDDEKYIAAIFYCKTEETALKLYEIVHNMYLDVIYTPDIYGFNNSYKLNYNLIDSVEINTEEINKIDYDLLNSIDYHYGGKEYIFGSLERAYLFPIMPLPENYYQFRLRKNYYTPQCYIKGNNIYFGSKKLLNLIV